jgi:hypothetical protein
MKADTTLKSFSWLILPALLLLEYSLFYHYISRNIITHYPQMVDQANYLYWSYGLYENILHKGFFTAISQQFLIPTSSLFLLQAAFFFLLTGASRVAALSLNFLYFAVLQLVTFFTIKKITGKTSLGFLFIGMLLSTESFFIAGGAADFRIDFIAMCLYGMLVCLVLLSNIFLRRNLSMVCGLLAGFLIAMRFLTVAYVVGVTGVMLAYLMLVLWQQKSRQLPLDDAQKRIKNILLFAVLFTGITIPVFYWNRELLYSYYIYGHLLGPEKIERARIAGVTSPLSAILFYPQFFLIWHVSYQTVCEIVFFFLVLLGLSKISAIKTNTDKNLQSHFNLEIFFLTVSTIIPLLILTLDTSKSQIACNIIMVPFLLLIVWSYRYLCQRLILPHDVTRSIVYLITAFFMIGGLVSYGKEAVSPRATNNKLVASDKLINAIGDYAVAADWKNIYAATDKSTDFFPSIPAHYYETKGVLFNFTATMGSSSQQPVSDKETALKKVAESNIFVTDTKAFVPAHYSGFEKSISSFQPQLKQVALQKMIKIGSYDIDGSIFEVYARPVTLTN